MLFPHLSVFVLISVMAPSVGAYSEIYKSDRIPVGWDLKEIAQASFYEGPSPTETRILTWQITEDERPLYIESCIAWFRFKKEGRDRWRLSHLYRHPKHKSPFNHWNIAMVFDANQVPEDDFDHPPTARELDLFLKMTWWHFFPEKGWKLIDSEICSHAWNLSFGVEPNKTYSSAPQNEHH